MLVSSKLFPEGTKTSTMHTLVLRYGPRHVLVPLPKTFQELVSITRSVFGAASGSTFLFETSDLNICQDASVEIHPASWEAIALTVSTVVVKNKDRGSPREYGEVLLRPHIRGNTSVTPKRAQKAASGSANEITRSENSPSGAGTSYDDIPDDFAEEELGSYDDNDEDVDLALAQRKGKGKARVRIESDDEREDGDEEGYVDAASPVVKLPASYRLRNAVEPSFSITPSPPPKRVTTLPRTVRGSGSSRGLFSPVKVRSSLAKTFPPHAHSDEEADVKPPAYQTAHVASDDSPHPGEAAFDATPLKETQNGDPTTRSTSKPMLHVATAVAPSTAPSNDKLLITIRYPPAEKENKFKVKATHTVGRVLSSACLAFGLDANGASLMHWSEEDGVETSYRCGNDLSMGSVAVEGAVFIIEVSKLE